MIDAQSQALIRTSREAVWRHLTRVPDWHRWYPGLHGVSTDDSVTGTGHSWRASGQLGRLLYRADQRVSDYELLKRLEITGDRRPWLKQAQITFELNPDGANCRLDIRITGEPSFGLAGRLIVSRTLKNRLQTEVEEIGNRFRQYVEQTMPHH